MRFRVGKRNGVRLASLVGLLAVLVILIAACGTSGADSDRSRTSDIGTTHESVVTAPAAGPDHSHPTAPAARPDHSHPTPVQPALRRTSKRLYWGATIGEQLTGEAAPWDMGAVRKFERIAGKRLSLVDFGAPFSDCNSRPCQFYDFPSTPFADIRSHGAIPFFSWSSDSSPSRVHQPKFQLADVISGRYDAYIRSWARKAKHWGHPFFLRFDWEMNGFWFPWNERANGNHSGQFIRAWRHVHRIFTSVGATNATWVWCPNIDFTRTLQPLRAVYPGGRFVDWTCLDGFNWGTSSSSTRWKTFGRIYRSTYRRVVRIAPHKPMVLGEVASTDKGGSKAAWIHDFLAKLAHRYAKIRGFLWFDVNDRGTNWPIETSSSARRAFRNGIARSAFRPNEFGDIHSRPIQPPG